MRPRLLVTGASGMLGSRVCRQALNGWAVTGIQCRNRTAVDGIQTVQLDLTHLPRLEELFQAAAPKAVIHTAAISQPARCEADPDVAHAINVAVSEVLAMLCARRRIPFIFTSTDLVFDGLKAPYDEGHPASPVCVYGRQKLEAEKAVLQRYPAALVCRLPLMFGLGHSPSANFSVQMLDAIRQGLPIDLLTDEFRTPVDYESAARGMLHLLGRAHGILHLGGGTRLSRYALGCLMARHMAVSPAMLRPVTLDQLPSAVKRSPDCSLDSRAARAMGYDPAPLDAAVKRVVDHYKVISKS